MMDSVILIMKFYMDLVHRVAMYTCDIIGFSTREVRQAVSI